MPDWDPEVEIDEPLVRALLDEQFPELATRPVRFVGKGWDNSVWVVDEEWTFRLPRRQIAIPGVERELAILPLVARLVPVSVPVPTLVGSASERFPWPFFAYRPLPGAEPADAELSDDERVRFAAQLAGFLRALHAPETRDAVDPGGALPIDFNLRADMSVRVPRARENLAYLRESRLWSPPAAVEHILGAAEGLAPASGGLVLAHGDLHLRHVLVADGALAGVIDWGDVCLADPCIDLMLVWSLLTPSARERFFADYGPVSEERRLRSRVLAINLDSMLARYAHDTGYASLQREAIAALERTLLE
jgi:aminoglycoside phosphotransferase (APT) family kinase protein